MSKLSRELRDRWPGAIKWRVFQASLDSEELAMKLADRFEELDWECRIHPYPDKSIWDIRAWTSYDNPSFDYEAEIGRLVCPKAG